MSHNAYAAVLLNAGHDRNGNTVAAWAIYAGGDLIDSEPVRAGFFGLDYESLSRVLVRVGLIPDGDRVELLRHIDSAADLGALVVVPETPTTRRHVRTVLRASKG